MASDMDDHASVVDESGISTMTRSGTSNSKKAVNGVRSFMTYDQRLSSFSQVLTRKRNSTAKGAKTMKLEWPAENPSPEKMAEAGFYFKPTVKDPDNVACFLCQKNLNGWEPMDNPREEHRVHSPECGWAICKCTRPSPNDDPQSEGLTLARMMTFTKWWPHENKKGWRAKVENLATAGFIYDPSVEQDDRVVCQYCDIQVDGWEPKDSPREFHQERRPNCPFFNFGVEKAETSENIEVVNLTKDEEEPTAKKGKAKAKKRASKAASSKKTTALRKAAAMQNEEEHEDYENMVLRDGALETDNEEAKPTTKKKAPRGQKRKSSAMEDEKENKPLYNQQALNAKVLERQLQHLQDVEEAKASPVKRRMTRASLAARESRFSLNVSVPAHLAQSSDDEASPKSLKNSPLKNRKKGGSRKASGMAKSRAASRKASATVAADAPVISAGMDDDEIDKALELDLQRPLSDEEDGGAKLNAELNAHVSDLASPVISRPQSPEETKPKGRGRRLTRTKPQSRDSELSEVEVPIATKPKRRLTRTKPQSRAIETDNESDMEYSSLRQSSRAKPSMTASRRSSRAAVTAPAPIIKVGKKATRTLKQVSSPRVPSEHEQADADDDEPVTTTPPRSTRKAAEIAADEEKEASPGISPPRLQEDIEDSIVVSPTVEKPSKDILEDSIIVSPTALKAPVEEALPLEPEVPDAAEDARVNEVQQPEIQEKPKKKTKKNAKAVKAIAVEEIPAIVPSKEPEAIEETPAAVAPEEPQVVQEPQESPKAAQAPEPVEVKGKKTKKTTKKGSKAAKAALKEILNVEVAQDEKPDEQLEEVPEAAKEEPKSATKKANKAARASANGAAAAPPPAPVEQDEEAKEEDTMKEPEPEKEGLSKGPQQEKETEPESKQEAPPPKRPRGRPSKTKPATKKSISPVKVSEPSRQSLKRKSSQEIVSPKSPKAVRTRMMTFDVEISPLKDSINGPVDPADISDLQVSDLQGASDIHVSGFQVSDIQDKPAELNVEDDIEATGQENLPKSDAAEDDQDVEISKSNEPAALSPKKTPAKKTKKQSIRSICGSETGRSIRRSEGGDSIDAVLDSYDKSSKESSGKVKRGPSQQKRASQSTSKNLQHVDEEVVREVPPSSVRKERSNASQDLQVSQSSSSPCSVQNTQFTDVSSRETQLTQYTEPSQQSPKKGVSFVEQVEVDQQIQSELELSFQAEQSRLSGDGYHDDDTSDLEELNNNSNDDNQSERRTPLSVSRNANANNFVVLATPSSRQQLVLRDNGKALVSTKPYKPMGLETLEKFQDENKAPLVPSLSQDERKMTVAQWIKTNAVQSEQRVMRVCENVVAAFEEQGRRAIASVEGIRVTDDY